MKLLPYQAVDLSFFDTANLRVATTVDIRCTPEVFFESLRGSTIWTEWAPVIKGVEWTSAEPYGHNSTRTVHLAAGMQVNELFFHWQEHERVSFYVLEGSIPDVQAFAEDYQIQPLNDDTLRFTWTVAMEMQGAAKLFIPVSRFFMRLVFKRWLNNYKKLLEKS